MEYFSKFDVFNDVRFNFHQKKKSIEFKNKEAATGWRGYLPLIKALTVPIAFPGKHENNSKTNVKQCV